MPKLNPKNILIGTISILVAWVFISKVIIPWVYKPRDTAKSRVANLKSKVANLKQLNILSENDEHYLAATSRNAFSMEESEAISRMGSHLTEAIKASELNEDRFTRRPLKATSLTKKGAIQIGYSVNGQGQLPFTLSLW